MHVRVRGHVVGMVRRRRVEAGMKRRRWRRRGGEFTVLLTIDPVVSGDVRVEVSLLEEDVAGAATEAVRVEDAAVPGLDD